MNSNKYKVFKKKFVEIGKRPATDKRALLDLAIEMQKEGFRINPYDLKGRYHISGEAESKLECIISSALDDFETKRRSRKILWIAVATLLAAVVSATCSIIFLFMN